MKFVLDLEKMRCIDVRDNERLLSVGQYYFLGSLVHYYFETRWNDNYCSYYYYHFVRNVTLFNKIYCRLMYIDNPLPDVIQPKPDLKQLLHKEMLFYNVHLELQYSPFLPFYKQRATTLHMFL